MPRGSAADETVTARQARTPRRVGGWPTVDPGTPPSPSLLPSPAQQLSILPIPCCPSIVQLTPFLHYESLTTFPAVPHHHHSYGAPPTNNCNIFSFPCPSHLASQVSPLPPPAVAMHLAPPALHHCCVQITITPNFHGPLETCLTPLPQQ